MTELKRFIRAILGQYSRPISRHMYFNLLCDNAALTSALEQKERARVLAVARSQELRRALSEAYRTIEVQWVEIERLQELTLCQAKAAAQLTVPSFSAGEIRWMVRNERHS